MALARSAQVLPLDLKTGDFLHLVTTIATGVGVDRAELAKPKTQQVLLGLQFSLAHSGGTSDRRDELRTFVCRAGRRIEVTNAISRRKGNPDLTNRSARRLAPGTHLWLHAQLMHLALAAFFPLVRV